MPRTFAAAADALNAAALKNEYSAYLAGGTEINRLGSSVSAENLISIAGLGLDTMEVLDTSCLEIGSCVTFQNLVENPVVPSFLKEAALFMSSLQKRNMATIGGNIALFRDDSYLCPTLVSCNARLVLAEEGELGIWDYLSGSRDAFKDSLILRVLVPLNAGVRSLRFANTEASHAVLTCAAGYSEGKQTLCFAVKGCGTAREEIPAFASETEALDWARNYKGLEFVSDMFGSAEYKRYLLGVSVYDLIKALGR